MHVTTPPNRGILSRLVTNHAEHQYIAESTILRQPVKCEYLSNDLVNYPVYLSNYKSE